MRRDGGERGAHLFGGLGGEELLGGAVPVGEIVRGEGPGREGFRVGRILALPAVASRLTDTRDIRIDTLLPVAPGVRAHSIIAVKGDGPPEQGDDGVVEYASAHITPVDSELVVRSGHSVQGHPLAIREVRRILLQHAGDAY